MRSLILALSVMALPVFGMGHVALRERPNDSRAMLERSERPWTCRDSSITVPSGAVVLVDGRFDEGEWADALELTRPGGTRLYLKQSAGYLYLGIRPATPSSFGVDAYFERSDSTEILNFHASAKLGERSGKLDNFPAWQWWNQHGWTANVVRPADGEPRRFLPDEGKEFQISLSRLRAASLWLSVDVHTSRTETLPASGVSRHARTWVALCLP